MHRLYSPFAIVLALALLTAAPRDARAGDLRVVGPRQAAVPADAEIVPGEVLVRFRPGASTAKRDPLSGDLGLVREDRLESLSIDRYRLPAGGDVWETVRRLRQRPDVLFAEPNFLAELAVVPDDEFYDNIQGHARDMQRWTFGGVTGDAGIDAEAAWEVSTGRPDVTIAVIDSGVALTHGDLSPNVWTNPGEVPGNGSDDDGNGFADDVHGWDFYSSDADPAPDLGNGRNDDGVGIGDDNTFHGTFVANLAAGRGNDGRGVLGAAWNCKVMPLKVFTDDGGANTFHIAAAFEYAADNGADVVNASLTTGTDSSTLREAVAYAVARDCVITAAAGNFNRATAYYPAAYTNVIAVGATGHAFEFSTYVNFFGPANFSGRPAFSNYGPAAVDVVAPGVVFSSSVASQTDADADPELEPGTFVAFAAEGTSFAAPIVAGLAALVVSRDKDLNGVRTLSNVEVIEIIESTANDLPDDPTDSPDAGAGWDDLGLVDFSAAVASVTGGPGDRTVRLDWQAPAGAQLAPPENLRATEAGGPSKLAGGPTAEAEPNNTLAAAQAVAVPATVAGQIATSDDGAVEIVYGDGSRDTVEDFYRLSLAAETSLSITLTPAGDADLDLGLMTDLDGNGEYTFEQEFLSANPASGPGQAEGLENLVLPAGTYYVACTIYDGAPRVDSDSYTLAITTGAPVVNAYRIYRDTTPGVAPAEANRIAQVSGSQLSFVDTTAPEGPVYYVVTAVYDAGESNPSNEAAPGAVDPNAPLILSPAYKKGKFTIAAAGSKIVAGSTLVVDDAESFTLTLTPDGSKWMVKKKARSVPGGKRIAQALLPGVDARLYVVTPGSLRSATVTFRRP
jgi:subtilisin family serine protease